MSLDRLAYGDEPFFSILIIQWDARTHFFDIFRWMKAIRVDKCALGISCQEAANAGLSAAAYSHYYVSFVFQCEIK